jgi:putative membrane protein
MSVGPLTLAVAMLSGALLGCLTGLVPGLHSNNVANIMGTGPGIVLGVALLGTADAEAGWALLASAVVVSCALAHTVANIVPSVYLAIPEGETALSVLPGHRMVMAGMGDEALRVSVTSSLASLATAMALVVPMAALMTWGAYGWMHSIWGPVLLGVSAVMVLRESEKTGRGGRTGGWRASACATVILLASGALGQLAVFEAGLMAPLFIGLFGVPMVLVAMMGGRPGPPPAVAGRARARFSAPPPGPVLRGALAGSLVGWFPGVSSAQATVLAVVGEVDDGDDVESARRFIAGVSAVNTANAVFTLVALCTLARVRSGAGSAVGALMGWENAPWGDGTLPVPEVAVLLVAAAVGGVVAAPVTLLAGRGFERAAHILSDRWAHAGLLLLLAILATLSGGVGSLTVLVAASALGTIPPLMGLMRVHLMGAVTLPLVAGLALA